MKEHADINLEFQRIDVSLAELDLDSLDLVQMLLMAEDILGKDMDVRHLKGIQTVSQLIEEVNKYV